MTGGEVYPFVFGCVVTSGFDVNSVRDLPVHGCYVKSYYLFSKRT